MDSSPGGERSNNKSNHMYVGEASRRYKGPGKIPIAQTTEHARERRQEP